MSAGVLKGPPDDAGGVDFRDWLDADARVWGKRLAVSVLDELDEVEGVGLAGFVFDAGVDVLRVLSDDDEVDVIEAGLYAGVALAGPETGVEVELLA